jgi:hypothetical protein
MPGPLNTLHCVFIEPWMLQSRFPHLDKKEPLNNNHLSTTATIIGPQGWSLSTGLTVLLKHFSAVH